MFYLGTFHFPRVRQTGVEIKEGKEKNRLMKENGESLRLHLHQQALLKHVDAYNALKLDRTSLTKNRCAFFSSNFPTASLYKEVCPYLV